jgi:hypothetical protein
MKKLIYLIMATGLLFTACNPMDDINAEIDAQENTVVGDAVFALTDADYEALDLSYGSFSSQEDAKAMLPDYLKGLYPVWGKGSSALVGYKLYIGNAFSVKDYKLTQADYTTSGSDLLGFQSDATPGDFLPSILADNITSPSEGDYVAANYYQFEGSASIVTPTVSLEENFDYGTTAGDLTAVSTEWTAHSGAGNGPIGYATTSLTMVDYPSINVGGSLTMSSSGSEDVNHTFSSISSGKVYASTLINLSTVGTGTYFFHFMDDTYGYSARVGAMDNGSGKILFGIGASSSTLTYGSTPFDLDTTYLLVASYNIDNGESNLYILSTVAGTEPKTPEATNTGNPGLVVQKIGVRQGGGCPTATLDGIRVANTWSSIMSNDVLEDEVIGTKVTAESLYTYTSGTWTEPSDIYILSSEDYDAMGTASGQPGKYNNFDGSMSIDTYISTFLGIKYPYAAAGDNLKVFYKYYSSSAKATLTRGNLYTVTDGAWEGHKSTIDTTLQFANDGTTWVPDNTIKYEFVGADYTYITDTFATVDGYADAVANLAKYGNISTYNWTDEQIDAVVGSVLMNNFPGMAEGQKFGVTIFVYDGSAHNITINYILEGGSYIRN